MDYASGFGNDKIRRLEQINRAGFLLVPLEPIYYYYRSVRWAFAIDNAIRRIINRTGLKSMHQAMRGAIKWILMDLDGTLYRQGPVRRRMALKLAVAHALRPLQGLSALKMIGAYRQAQEHLRENYTGFDLASDQVLLAAESSGSEAGVLRECVSRWMEREPLPLLESAMDPFLPGFLARAKDQGCKLGIVSDYPSQEKLEAMGIRRYFQAVVSAQDPGVQRFKPDPRGILVAMQYLGASSEGTVYIGDRVDVDGKAATRAGIRSLILGADSSDEVAGIYKFPNWGCIEDWIFGAMHG